MRVFILDNHDSFTYNLVNILRKVSNLHYDIHYPEGLDIKIIASYDKILFSPGPDIPHHGDPMHRILETYREEKSILGICLGFQAICLYFGATLENMNKVVHGKAGMVNCTGPSDNLFQNIPKPFNAGLYHSWMVSPEMFPEILNITARSNDGVIMATTHKKYDIKGVQFHPESILTPAGEQMILNWLEV